MAVETERVALVTGASSGIGEAAAQALLAAGFTVYGTSRRAIAGEERDGVVFLPLDVTDDQSAAGAVREVLADPAASTCWSTTRASASPARRRRARSSRLGLCSTPISSAAMRMTRAVLPQMREQGSGRIINLSSVLGLVPAPFGALVRGDQARHRGVLGVAGPRGARVRGPRPSGRARPTQGPRSTRTPSPPINPFRSTRDAARCSTD